MSEALTIIGWAVVTPMLWVTAAWCLVVVVRDEIRYYQEGKDNE